MKDKKTSMDQSDAPAEQFSLIPHETLLALYRNLLKCRVTRAKGKRPGNAWPFDAAMVAVAAKLLADDTVIAGARIPMFELPGTDSAPQAEFPVQLQIAVGAALGAKTKKTGRIAAVFGRKDRGEAWRDTLETARAHRLPMIFVWDSGDQVTDHSRSRRARRASELEPGSELAHITADGNDVVAMYRVAHEAVERARRDRGPTLIECIPFRVAGRKLQDAIANMESYLRSKGLLRPGLKQEFIEEIAQKARR